MFQVPKGRTRTPQTSTDFLKQSEVNAEVHIFIQQTLVECPLGTRCSLHTCTTQGLGDCSHVPFIAEDTKDLGMKGTQPGRDRIGIETQEFGSRGHLSEISQ